MKWIRFPKLAPPPKQKNFLLFWSQKLTKKLSLSLSDESTLPSVSKRKKKSFSLLSQQQKQQKQKKAEIRVTLIGWFLSLIAVLFLRLGDL